MRGSTMLPRHWKRGLSLFVCAALVGCQLPQSSAPRVGLPANVAPGGGSIDTPLLQTVDTQIVGRADFPELAAGYGVQAASEYLTNGATLTLVSLADNMTVVTGRTQPDGSFVLPINGFTPASNSYYLLEASRGLGNNAAGSAVARFRTYLRWTGTSWTSISGSTIVINPQTTAVAIISSLDAANVPVPATMGKISGTNILPTPALTGHDDAEIFTLASTLSNYLTNDFDPVGSITRLTPSVESLQPANPTLNGAMVIRGNGFSPLPTGNTVRFENAKASIFSASPTALGVFVPGDAPNFGNVTVETSTGISTNNGYYTISASGGGGAGGGDGGGGSGEGVGGFGISSLQPALGIPGDTIMIRGSGFASNPVSNTVVFAEGATASVSYADPATLIVTVPDDAISGPLKVTVAGSTRGFFFNVNLPAISSFTPHDGDNSSVLTIRGQNFGQKHSTSRVVFNDLQIANVLRWSPNEIVLNPPGPQLTHRVTGKLRVVNDMDRMGRPTPETFTGRTAYDEGFTVSSRAHANTTAEWSGAQLRPGATVYGLNHAGRELNRGLYVPNQFITFTDQGARLLSRAIQHGTPGSEGNSNYTSQLGVDETHYYLAGQTNATNARRRYSLLTGQEEGQWTARITTYENLIWDRASRLYYTFAGSGNGTRRLPAWNSTSAEATPNAWIVNYSSSYYAHNAATTGTHLLQTWNAGWWIGWRINENENLNSMIRMYSMSPNISATSVYAMAGINGYPRIFVTDSSTDTNTLKYIDVTDIETASSLPTGPVSLPFFLNRFGPSNNLVPRIGSDGRDLYALAKNPSFNNNNDSLVRFTINPDTHALNRANAYDTENVLTGTLISPTITKPSNRIWHTLEFGHTAPLGTTLTIDILNADTEVPIPGWTNLSHGADLNTLTADRVKLKATLTGTPENSPMLNWWRISYKGSYALSKAYDTGSIDPLFETETVTRDNENFTITYRSSAGGADPNADNWNWSAWNADPTKLTGRYIQFRVVFSRSNGKVTRVKLPYTY